MSGRCNVRHLGRSDYLEVWRRMQAFTGERGPESPDEIWLVEHPPVFTLGQTGRKEHLLTVSDIPVVHSDRGGEVTYHGPGQIVMYLMIDLRRRLLGVRGLVTLMEETVLELLAQYGVQAEARPDAPGVYVAGRKVAALGLRVRKGCSYHGLSLNVAMDLAPFRQINPCGHEGLQVTDTRSLGIRAGQEQLAQELARIFRRRIGYDDAPTAT